MATAVHMRDADLQPRSAGGGWQGITLSILVHAGLIAALLWGFRWSQPTVDVVAAELWAAVPQSAGPPPPPPPPAPTAAPAPPPKPAPVVTPKPPAQQQADADIALEKARKAKAEEERAEKLRADKLKAEKAQAEKDARDKRQKEERERLEKAEKAEKAAKAERDPKAKLEADKRAKAAADQELAKQREQNLARMMGQLGGAGPAQTGATGSAGAPSASYAGRLVAAIKPNIVFAETLPGNPAAEVEVRAGPGGTILGRTLVKSSGHPEWDEAVLRAIDRTGTLPRDVDGRVPPRLTITFRPRD